MNELQKTQRISIAVFILALILLVGFMVQKSPVNVYTLSAEEMLEKMDNFEHVTPAIAKNIHVDTNAYIFVDLRSPYQFEVSHIPHAINISRADILDPENKVLFEKYLASGKKVILYCDNERDAISPWILLTELGFTNTQVLLGGFLCFNETSSHCILETPRYDFAKIASEGKIIQEVVPEPEPIKKEIPILQKPKKAAEGGC
jgi:rhodanese-related sulfurtransferase